jgi:hypothetical protein
MFTVCVDFIYSEYIKLLGLSISTTFTFTFDPTLARLKAEYASSTCSSITPTDASRLQCIQQRNLCLSVSVTSQIYLYVSENTHLHSLRRRSSDISSFRFIVASNPGLRCWKIVIFVSQPAMLGTFSRLVLVP